MANQAQDPWKTEYHGVYLSNAGLDGKDRGAIIMYSNGANQELGSEHDIYGGVTSVVVPGNNVHGKDDYSIATVYTYVNGYGEVNTTTTGFSNNQGNNNQPNLSASNKTYKFSDNILTSRLETIFNNSTCGTQDEDYVYAVDSPNHYIEIYKTDEGLFGIIYHDYVADITYDYVTKENSETYGDPVGWHNCDNHYELVSGLELTFTAEDEEYVFMPNGLRDLAALFN